MLEAGYSAAARERAQRARRVVRAASSSEHKDEITALQVLYSRPYAQRLRLAGRQGAGRGDQGAAALLDARGALAGLRDAGPSQGARLGRHAILTDLVSLVRFALHQDDELVPFPEQVEARFAAWLAAAGGRGRRFTAEQRAWLELIRDHIAASLRIEPDDFDVRAVQPAGRARAGSTRSSATSWTGCWTS